MLCCCYGSMTRPHPKSTPGQPAGLPGSLLHPLAQEHREQITTHLISKCVNKDGSLFSLHEPPTQTLFINILVDTVLNLTKKVICTVEMVLDFRHLANLW